MQYGSSYIKFLRSHPRRGRRHVLIFLNGAVPSVRPSNNSRNANHERLKHYAEIISISIDLHSDEICSYLAQVNSPWLPQHRPPTTGHQRRPPGCLPPLHHPSPATGGPPHFPWRASHCQPGPTASRASLMAAVSNKDGTGETRPPRQADLKARTSSEPSRNPIPRTSTAPRGKTRPQGNPSIPLPSNGRKSDSERMPPPGPDLRQQAPDIGHPAAPDD